MTKALQPSKRAASSAVADKARDRVAARPNGAAHSRAADKAKRVEAAPTALDEARHFVAAPPWADQLAELQVRRKFYISAISRLTNSAKALVRRYLGWQYDTAEDERTKLNERAAKHVAAALHGDAAIIPDLIVTRIAIEPLQAARDDVEREMKTIVRTLPIYQWARQVTGLGELGLGVILAEAGDLARYPSKGHLWKRLGLAPFEGKAYSTWRREGGLTAEQWTEAGYSPRRRAEMYAVVAEPLMRHQTRVGGPYRAVYEERRRRTAEAHPDWTKGHSHADGLRVMTKVLLRDLWREYRLRAGVELPARADPAVAAAGNGSPGRDSPAHAEHYVPGGPDPAWPEWMPEVSVRAMHALLDMVREGRITTLGDLRAVPDAELLARRNLGRTTLRELRDVAPYEGGQP